MPRIKNVLLTSLVLAAPSLFSHSAQALEYKNAFGSINAGYADWNSGFVNVHRGEVWKATADFGINFKEAEFYSFYESNVLNHSVAGRNHTVSAMTHVRLFDSNYTFFGKLYGQWENTWGDDLDMFYGLGYLGWTGNWGFFKPYIGLNNQSGDYVSQKYGQTSGWNGYVLGWTAAYNFTLLEEKFVLSNWNEIEFDRNNAYAEQQYGDYGINGGLTLAWKFYPCWKATVTWRYFENKLGYDGFGDQMIYMVGYEF
ncbi:outer membrane protein OmpK [Citrobacter sp. CtB7.12]|uniref:outer membrane protein OmpK n=1 Tax=Citrobacter sp. CtB7.12 TaxID=1696093 RepID=UPI0006BA36F0|nr:outer membrane protein OmpK [Citrobacter sp. CtB7.12]